MARRKIRYRKNDKVVVLNGFVRQVLKIKKTKRGAQAEADRLNKQRMRGYWYDHKVVETDQGYAIVLVPKRITKSDDIKYNSLKVQKPYLR